MQHAHEAATFCLIPTAFIRAFTQEYGRCLFMDTWCPIYCHLVVRVMKKPYSGPRRLAVVMASLRDENDALSDLANKLFAHAAEKGGQARVDRSKINSIVMSLTGSSAYTQEKLSHEAEAAEWAKGARRKLSTFDARQNSASTHRVREAESKLRLKGGDEGWCCVVDFDMFFAAVEIRDRPELKDKPVAVGGLGMISTANYVARQWGVRSAMPGWIGRELCRRGEEFGMPKAELVFVKPDFNKYVKVAQIARDIFTEYDPDFRSSSLDEAYLRLPARTKQQAENMVSQIRSKVFAATRLTMSGGVGSNFFLAKIAADVKKPNGQFTIQATTPFFFSLPCRKAPGVGRVLEQKLKEGLGVTTLGELRDNMPQVYHCFPPKTREFLHRVALGLDHDYEATMPSVPKGVGHERTFRPTNDQSVLRRVFRDLCHAVHQRLAEANLKPLKCSLKLKRDDFRVAVKTANASASLEGSLEPLLVAELRRSSPTLRLIGVRAFSFANAQYNELRGSDQPTIDNFFHTAASAAVEGVDPLKSSSPVPTTKRLNDEVEGCSGNLQTKVVYKRHKPDPDSALSSLIEMGFDSEVATAALQRHEYDLDATLEVLLAP